jgi:ribonuclease HI
MVFYAVANGRNIQIFSNWTDCSHSVKGFKHAIYKKFDTMEEAELFMQTHRKQEEEKEEVAVIDYYVYTDGGCSKNGQDTAVAGIGIFFGVGDTRNVSKTITGKQTNNTAELSAIIETYSIIETDVLRGKKIAIVSDSEYAIKCVSSYGEKCSKKNWNVDIPNKELVRTVYNMYKDRQNVTFIHIKAHTNQTDVHSVGNNHADRLASKAIE